MLIEPHVGIGPIRLGAHRDDVRSAMFAAGFALESERDATDFFAASSIQVGYEDDGTASFIGVSSDPAIELIFGSVDLFDTSARDVFSLLASSDDSGGHEFSEFEYVFPKQIVTLYDADPQYDYRQAESRAVWGQIGCGDQRYLDAIIRINKGVLNPARVKQP